MPNAVFRFASEYASRIIGVALGSIVITGIVGAWSYAFSHQVWLDRTITAAIAIALVAITTAVLSYVAPPQEEARPRKWKKPSAKGLLEVTGSLIGPPKNIKLRILATEQGRPIARFLVEVFKTYNWDIDVNHSGGSYIFPIDAAFEGIRFRYRENAQTQHIIWTVLQAVSKLTDDVPITDPFPDTDAFNFIQIEIGDPSDYQILD